MKTVIFAELYCWSYLPHQIFLWNSLENYISFWLQSTLCNLESFYILGYSRSHIWCHASLAPHTCSMATCVLVFQLPRSPGLLQFCAIFLCHLRKYSARTIPLGSQEVRYCHHETKESSVRGYIFISKKRQEKGHGWSKAGQRRQKQSPSIHQYMTSKLKMRVHI